MSSVINLNKARKAKARTNGPTIAIENRVKFGRTKAEKVKGKMESERLSRAIDDAKREP